MSTPEEDPYENVSRGSLKLKGTENISKKVYETLRLGSVPLRRNPVKKYKRVGKNIRSNYVQKKEEGEAEEETRGGYKNNRRRKTGRKCYGSKTYEGRNGV
ncbi:uncharacterized protein LOC122511041 isoform X2 [Leptopilina heterotoma]|uniref:uncharacterized protein LOC122511041 isoform X2 n=1 Tax=Leptopilina heterotoma TaxID=63436 RepID=UPI001CA80E65|nr:uncharacterized protein LOC122511041 isoform X2 [Leptopilina heterotoma]